MRVTISQKRKLELKKQQRQKLVWIQNTADRRGGGELVLFHVIKPDRRERTCRGRQRCLSSVKVTEVRVVLVLLSRLHDPHGTAAELEY